MVIKDIKMCNKPIGDQMSLEELIVIADSDDNILCRCKAIDELGKRNESIEAASAIFDIILRIDKKDLFLRYNCALPAIVKMKKEIVLELMKQKLKDSDENIRYYSIEVVGELLRNGDPDARTLLWIVSDDQNESRRNRGLAKNYLNPL